MHSGAALQFLLRDLQDRLVPVDQLVLEDLVLQIHLFDLVDLSLQHNHRRHHFQLHLFDPVDPLLQLNLYLLLHLQLQYFLVYLVLQGDPVKEDIK